MTEETKELSYAERRRGVATRALAVYFCRIASIDPVDRADGSENWWMFLKDAEKVYDDLMARFPWKSGVKDLDDPSN